MDESPLVLRNSASAFCPVPQGHKPGLSLLCRHQRRICPIFSSSRFLAPRMSCLAVRQHPPGGYLVSARIASQTETSDSARVINYKLEWLTTTQEGPGLEEI